MFGSETQIFASSSIWNLAGDYPDRVNLRKTMLLSTALGSQSISTNMMKSILNGPAKAYRSYLRYTNRVDPAFIPASAFTGAKQLDNVELAMLLGAPAGKEIFVETAWIGQTDAYYWARDWLRTNYPGEATKAWTYTYNEGFNRIFIFMTESTNIYYFDAWNFVPSSNYLYVDYYYFDRSGDGNRTPVNVGNIYGPVLAAGLPDDEDFNLINTSSSSLAQPLNQTVVTDITYSDDTPEEHDTEIIPLPSATFTETRVLKRRRSAATLVGDNYYADEIDYENWTIPTVGTTVETTTHVEVIPSGDPLIPDVTKTTVTTTTTEMLSASTRYLYKWDVYQTQLRNRTQTYMFLYRRGSGNATLDALFGTQQNRTVYPVIPLRINNKFITEPPYDTALYPSIKRNYRKMSNGGSVDEILSQLNTNESIGDIDFAYLVFGVPFNSKSKEGKRYVFEYYKQIWAEQGAAQVNFEQAITYDYAYAEYQDRLVEYYNNPVGDAPEPPPHMGNGGMNPTVHEMNINQILHDYRIRVECLYVTRDVVSGQISAGAKVGSVIMTPKADTTRVTITERHSSDDTYYDRNIEYIPVVEIMCQTSATEYELLRVVGATHNNSVYGYAGIRTTSKEALNDPEDSGFFLPLDQAILDKLPKLWANQLVIESNLMLLNCYVEKKVRWYQRGFFKALIAAALIFVGGYFMPGGWAAGSGILGGNVAVGTAIGVSAAYAAMVGALANAIVGVIFSIILTNGSTAIFGDKLGQIISSIVSITMSFGSSGLFGNGFSLDLSLLSKPEFLMKITSSISNAYVATIEGKMTDLAAESAAYNVDAQKQLDEIQRRFAELNGTAFDFSTVLDAVRFKPETRDVYLTRTLLTAGDMRDLSLDLIGEFANLNTHLPDAFNS